MKHISDIVITSVYYKHTYNPEIHNSKAWVIIDIVYVLLQLCIMGFLYLSFKLSKPELIKPILVGMHISDILFELIKEYFQSISLIEIDSDWY